MQRTTLAAKVSHEATGHDRAGGFGNGDAVRGPECRRPSSVDKGWLRFG